MTLTTDVDGSLVTTTSEIFDRSASNWDSLYCSHLWSNSHLRRAIINANHTDNNKMIKYCYSCKGKIRKYEIKSPKEHFIPNTHSTPNGKTVTNNYCVPVNSNARCEIVEDTCSVVLPSTRSSSVLKDIEPTGTESNLCVPSISQQVDASYRQKYSSYEPRPSNGNNRRLRKSLKGIGCVVSLALADSSVKKRTQIQACSISVMIVAIVVISFVLVNFTSPNINSNLESSIAVPTQLSNTNETSSAISNSNVGMQEQTETTSIYYSTTVRAAVVSSETTTKHSDVIAKIRKNIRTYPKDVKNNLINADEKPKDINNRDLSQKFCSCQIYEVCMLDENSGTGICKKAIDIDDPTGCGGLCALETEACQVVDRARGVRVCRLLTLVTCYAREWRCRNGLCVDAAARCDGAAQCYDRSDEINCDCDLTKQFRCGHSISCFPNSKLCDGVIDCWDGVDEVNCTAACPAEQFTCTNGQCIIQSRFCDGLADCADRSDEPRGCDGGCGSREIRCGNRRCVPAAARCDGRDQCGDATDEQHCSS